MDQIRSLEGRMYEHEKELGELGKESKAKIQNSKYLNDQLREKQRQLAAERGEEIAALKLRKENLESDRDRIMSNLEKIKNGDLGSLRVNEASRWVGTDILKGKESTDLSGLEVDPSMKEQLVVGQTRINRLKEERKKMEREAFPMIDELDVLEKELKDKEYA